MKEMKKYNEEDIVNLEKVINTYKGYVCKIISNNGDSFLSKEDKEEIFSDTFFVLWKNRKNIDKEKSLKPYIAGIVKNLIREKRRVVKIDCNIDDYSNDIKDIKDIEMFVEDRDKIDKIEKILLKMKKEDIMIFKLYYYSSRSIKEISKEINISEFSIKSKLFRIRKKIKKELEKGGYSYGE